MLGALMAAVLAAAAATVGPVPADVAPAPDPPEHRVLAISVDGLSVATLEELGRRRTPHIHRLLDEGAGTLDARTMYEQTVTLPNHTSMLTGRRITAARRGHGVTWNDDRPGTTVQQAAGHRVASVFGAVHAAGGDTALYTTKEKFGLFERSWPHGIDTYAADEHQRHLVRAARADLRDGAATFTFVHLSLTDRAGHEHGGGSEEYADALEATDVLVGRLLRAVSRDDEMTVVLTADHGFPRGTSHSRRMDPANYTVPFLVWGNGVGHGDLYDLNPDRREPRHRRPSYRAARQPVRNGDLANLATGLPGLDRVRGSRFGAGDPLVVAR